jgi:hypothetical protein
MEVRKWLRQQSKDFYAAGFDALVKQRDKCIIVGGGYVEKYIYIFFQFRILHVLRFLYFYDLFTHSLSYISSYYDTWVILMTPEQSSSHHITHPLHIATVKIAGNL